MATKLEGSSDGELRDEFEFKNQGFLLLAEWCIRSAITQLSCPSSPAVYYEYELLHIVEGIKTCRWTYILQINYAEIWRSLLFPIESVLQITMDIFLDLMRCSPACTCLKHGRY
jgi:hypothetical protein